MTEKTGGAAQRPWAVTVIFSKFSIQVLRFLVQECFLIFFYAVTRQGLLQTLVKPQKFCSTTPRRAGGDGANFVNGTVTKHLWSALISIEDKNSLTVFHCTRVASSNLSAGLVQ